MRDVFALCCFLAMPSLTFAQDQAIVGSSFSHLSWEVYCSNTGTCRAAGYQDESSGSAPASLLLTRQAGSKQAVKAAFAVSDFEESLPANKLQNIHFYVNGKDLGAVAVDGTETPLMGSLSASQVKTLLQYSKQKAEIVFKNAHYQWQVSDVGMTAALLKMDDFQQRVGTVGALVKKGKADESKVLAAQPKLMVRQVKTANKPYLTLQPKTAQYQAVYRSLMASIPKHADYEMCDGIYDGENEAPQLQPIALYKLSNHKVLATTLCWRAAYNEGYGAWVLDESLTGHASFVTAEASDVEAGVIRGVQKGRGIGDCLVLAQWVWDGARFVQTMDRWTGMCKGLAAGGVWRLGLIESVVR